MDYLGCKRREPRCWHDDGGFTLIEMIVVIILMSVFVSMAIPSMRETLFSDPLKSTARKLIATVKNVRYRAREEGKPFVIFIDRGSKMLWYSVQIAAAEDKDEEEVEKEGEQQLPEDISIGDVMTEGGDSADLDVSKIWVSEKGYVNRTRLELADDDGDSLYLDFFPFIMDVAIGGGEDAFSR